MADAKEQVAGGPSRRLWAFEFDIAHVAHELDRTEEAQSISNSPFFFTDTIKHQMLMAGLYRYNNLHIYIYSNNCFLNYIHSYLYITHIFIIYIYIIIFLIVYMIIYILYYFLIIYIYIIVYIIIYIYI